MEAEARHVGRNQAETAMPRHHGQDTKTDEQTDNGGIQGEIEGVAVVS
jgi:hypothetical protein